MTLIDPKIRCLFFLVGFAFFSAEVSAGAISQQPSTPSSQPSYLTTFSPTVKSDKAVKSGKVGKAGKKSKKDDNTVSVSIIAASF